MTNLDSSEPRPTKLKCPRVALCVGVCSFRLICTRTLDIVVRRGRDKAAALKLMRKLLTKQGFAPTVIVTDKLRSYAAAFAELGLSAEHERGLRQNNRAEVSHQPVRRRGGKMQRLVAPHPIQPSEKRGGQ
jgi:transposase-like protein